MNKIPDDVIRMIDEYSIEWNLLLVNKELYQLLNEKEDNQFKYRKKLKYTDEYKDILYKFVNLEEFYCSWSWTRITQIPNTLVNLKILYCRETQITQIPKELVNLEVLYCARTQYTNS